jgi:hypothetical protein
MHRRLRRFAIAVLPVALLWSLATFASLASVSCKSSSSGLACGEGTTQQGNDCIAVVEAGASDDATTGASPDAGMAADAAVAPVFAGVTAVAPASSTELLVAWQPGSQPGDPEAALRYLVYAGPANAPLEYAMPAATARPGATSALVTGLQPGTAYVVGVRAVNAAGVQDGNTVQLDGTPADDTKPPTFAGLKAAAPGAGGQVALSWDAAQDDLTPPAAMQYLVYESDTAGNEDFTAPVLVTAPGAASAIVGRLPNANVARYFVVRARDAAGNVDANTAEKSSTPGPDVTPPQFAGCSAATTVMALSIGVSWPAASDDVSAPSDLRYDVYATTKPGQYDFTQPFAVITGQTSALIPALQPSTRYYFVCRAKDQAGNEDANLVEASATTGANPTPPTFAGLTGLTGDPVARTATLTWSAGTDPNTPQNDLLYDVYVAQATMAEVFSKPPLATSAAGATSIMLTSLAPNATLYFVVRARDADGNHDSNTVEKSMVTNVSFSLNVQTIFADDCGVVGCHVPGNPTGNLILAPGFAYQQIHQPGRSGRQLPEPQDQREPLRRAQGEPAAVLGGEAGHANARALHRQHAERRRAQRDRQLDRAGRPQQLRDP